MQMARESFVATANSRAVSFGCAPCAQRVMTLAGNALRRQKTEKQLSQRLQSGSCPNVQPVSSGSVGMSAGPGEGTSKPKEGE